MNRSKQAKRQDREDRLKEMPLVNFYIILSALLQIIGQLFRISILQWTKPVPIIMMIIYIHRKKKIWDHLMPSLIEVGLIICLLGDICLMSNEPESFIVGTICFTVAHLVYIVAFRTGQKVRQLQGAYVNLRRIAYIAIIGTLITNFYGLWDKFPTRPIFLFYMIVLAFEVIVMLSRYEITTPNSFYFTMIGVILFAVSDNVFGYLKFNQIKTDIGRAFVMLTYYSAQYFIMHGSLHQSNLQHAIDKITKKF